jgi:CheY-like chemotaxis protein
MEQKINILMVDDQPAKLLTYEAILCELGENLVKAASGREALDLLLKIDIAVVLMDVSMPELDGFQLAELIRQHPRFQKIAIIFISAVHLTDLDRLKGYQRGAITSLFRWYPKCCAPKSACSPSCTGEHVSWSG